jgi:glutathione S-transferase
LAAGSTKRAVELLEQTLASQRWLLGDHPDTRKTARALLEL